MKDSSRVWMKYSRENLLAAKLMLENDIYNPCLQNAQQAAEKALKALCVESSVKLRKTHSILELRDVLENRSISVEISDEECEFLDSIYLPSKYPLSSALPNFEPGIETCKKAIQIAERVIDFVKRYLDRHSPFDQ